ncbi:MAG TPA: hypothetical protein VNZ52_10430 [Candidatus Thermoplasmatota archaeon]|nr:hypothetical protein [Candidatus Thermoplasmatota archaeon]
MANRVYEVPSKEKANLDKYLATDPISRLSITVKDAKSYGVEKGGTLLLFLEGDEAVLKQTQADLEKLGAVVDPKADEHFKQLKDEEDEAAGGVGFIFG